MQVVEAALVRVRPTYPYPYLSTTYVDLKTAAIQHVFYSFLI